MNDLGSGAALRRTGERNKPANRKASPLSERIDGLDSVFDGRVQVSALEGNTPRWSPDGKALFFRSGRSLMAGDVHTVKDGIDCTNERKVFDADIVPDYDVPANGDIFTMAPAPEIAYQEHVQLRTRWFDELERVMRGSR